MNGSFFKSSNSKFVGGILIIMMYYQYIYLFV